MIGGTGLAHLPLKCMKRVIIPMASFNFKFVKSLDNSAVLDGRNVVDGKLSDWGTARSHQETGSPDAQGHDRYQSPMSKMKYQ